MDYPKIIVSHQKEESISEQRVMVYVTACELIYELPCFLSY